MAKSGKWELWGHPLFGAGWRRSEATAEDNDEIDRFERRPLPFQPARRRRKLRGAVVRMPFLGVVTDRACDATGATILTGKKLTARPHVFAEGEEFTAFAGTDAFVITDSMVLVYPIDSPADDRDITHFAIPHISVNRGHLVEPDDPDCMAYLDWKWDIYIDPDCGHPEDFDCPSDPCPEPTPDPE